MKVHVRPASAWAAQQLCSPQPLTPVGRDCDCGFPLVWVGDRKVCSVYGSHPPVLSPSAQPVQFVENVDLALARRALARRGLAA